MRKIAKKLQLIAKTIVNKSASATGEKNRHGSLRKCSVMQVEWGAPNGGSNDSSKVMECMRVERRYSARGGREKGQQTGAGGEGWGFHVAKGMLGPGGVDPPWTPSTPPWRRTPPGGGPPRPTKTQIYTTPFGPPGTIMYIEENFLCKKALKVKFPLSLFDPRRTSLKLLKKISMRNA